MAISVHDLPADPDDRPWLRHLLAAFVILLLLGGAAFAAYKMGVYGSRRAQEKLADPKLNKVVVDAEFASLPAQLSKDFVESDHKDAAGQKDSLLNEVTLFAALQGRTANGDLVYNYSRLQNPQDSAVLRDLAGFLQEHTEQRNKAWIKSIRSIRRQSDPQANTETILIDADFREALGFIAQGDAYYLVEKVSTLAGQKQAVRLPGVYTLAQRRSMAELPCVAGIDSATPQPGEAFKTPDAIAGLELAEVLAQKPYIRQIAAIDMSNYLGRRDPDPLKPFIVLDTVFPNPANPAEPTLVRWGRPVGEEEFYEVRSPAKLNCLTSLFMKYGRIDAAGPWVDLRFDQPMVPMATTPGHTDAAPTVAAPPRV